MKHKIVRFIYTRNVIVFWWPTRRMRAVWWMYEFYVNEKRRNLATQLKLTCEAVQDWLASCRT